MTKESWACMTSLTLSSTGSPISSPRANSELSHDCLSEWGVVPGGGGPQGTKLGSWLFINMINELDVPATDLWKYIDDTTTVWSRGVRAVQDVCY